MAADYLDRRAGTEHTGPDNGPGPDGVPHRQRLHAPASAVPDGGDAAAGHLLRVHHRVDGQGAVAGRKEIRHMPGAAHHGAVGVAVDHAGKKVLPGPVDHGVKHGLTGRLPYRPCLLYTSRCV